MLMSMSGYGFESDITCETCAARWKTTSRPATRRSIASASRTSQRSISTASRISRTLASLPPYPSIMASQSVTRAPCSTSRRARFDPMKPSPPVTRTRAPERVLIARGTIALRPAGGRGRGPRRPASTPRVPEQEHGGRERSDADDEPHAEARRQVPQLHVVSPLRDLERDERVVVRERLRRGAVHQDAPALPRGDRGRDDRALPRVDR